MIKYKSKAFKAQKNNGSKIRLTSGGTQIRNIMSIQPSIDATDAHRESIQEPFGDEGSKNQISGLKKSNEEKKHTKNR